MSKRIEVILKKDGSFKVEAYGFDGAECVEKAKFIQRLYGDAKSIGFKESFYRTGEAEMNGLPSGHCG